MNQNVTAIVEILKTRPENEPLGLLTALNASQMVFSDSENFVQFAVKGDRDVNKVKVSYDNGADLFNVEFFNINLRRKEMVRELGEVKGLYDDQLVQAIWRKCVLV